MTRILLTLILCLSFVSCVTSGQLREEAYKLRQENTEVSHQMAAEMDKMADIAEVNERKLRDVGLQVSAIGGNAATGNLPAAIAGIVALLGGGVAASRAKKQAKVEVNSERNLARLERGESISKGPAA